MSLQALLETNDLRPRSLEAYYRRCGASDPGWSRASPPLPDGHESFRSLRLGLLHLPASFGLPPFDRLKPVLLANLRCADAKVRNRPARRGGDLSEIRMHGRLGSNLHQVSGDMKEILGGDFHFSGLLSLSDLFNGRQILLDRGPDVLKGFRFCFTLGPAPGQSRA